MTADNKSPSRSVVFISKATPGDDEFALWLAPRLEAAGYEVFADILALEAGDRWRNVLTDTLQNKAVKMLLVCKDATLAANGVDEEIAIATDLAKQLKDPKFIIPLRLEDFKKKFGIGGLQYVDFVRGWATGLENLLDTLRRQKVVRSDPPKINPHWEAYRRRNAIVLENTPERLTSNWMRISQVPDVIRYLEPTGAVDRYALTSVSETANYPMRAQANGIVFFGTAEEASEELASLGKFKTVREYPLLDFVEKGAADIGLSGRDASNMVSGMFRLAFERLCRNKGLLEYRYSKYPGFHISEGQAKIGERIPWGKQGDRRSSMLRNVAKGHVWQYGVTAIPMFWPFFHFRLKSRVLFAPPKEVGDTTQAGDAYDDEKKQHRLRRTVCKGWRNKQWHGRMMAFIELLSGDSALIRLPLSPSADVAIEAAPMLFTSPVSTVLPNKQQEDEEEADESTLGRPEPEEEDN
jgi:hypothetical protein